MRDDQTKLKFQKFQNNNFREVQIPQFRARGFVVFLCLKKKRYRF